MLGMGCYLLVSKHSSHLCCLQWCCGKHRVDKQCVKSCVHALFNVFLLPEKVNNYFNNAYILWRMSLYRNYTSLSLELLLFKLRTVGAGEMGRQVTALVSVTLLSILHHHKDPFATSTHPDNFKQPWKKQNFQALPDLEISFHSAMSCIWVSYQ